MKRNLRFGIELEVATSKSQNTVVEALREAGIDAVAERYGSHVRFDQWKVQYDGSINGWEIVSPPLSDTKELEIVCHVLRKVIKARSSIKTGLHIHHDINDFNLNQIKNLYKLYSKYEMNAIKSIMSPHRHNNLYCEPVTPVLERVLQSETIEEFKKSIHSRYHNLNHKAYIKYGTIEFRGAQGTVEIDRVLAWIELTHKMVETAASMTNEKEFRATNKEEALEEMFDEFGIQGKTAKHYKSVQKYFSKLA